MKNFLKNFFDIKFWKFILVGIINTLVGNGLQFILYNFTPLNSLESTGVFIASAMGYIIGSIVSYFLNKYFTFKNSEKGWRPIVRFAVNIAVCWVIAYVIAIPLTAFICTSMSLGLFGMSVADTSANLSMLVGRELFLDCHDTGQRCYGCKEK
jgi:putative flippase GtrA